MLQQELAARFSRVRRRTEELARPLGAEDQQLQSMPSASPTKWHRAHTTWFFETFVLEPNGIAPIDRSWGRLFNSYYHAIGAQHDRGKRGLLSRPTSNEIAAYRAAIDARVVELLLGATPNSARELEPLISLGIAHEEQHQELLLTDILHAFSEHPFRPAYRSTADKIATTPSAPLPLTFVPFDGGHHQIGAGGEFAFDNERPRHRRWAAPFSMANRLVTVAEMKSFISDGGYRTHSLWLSDGWDFVCRNHIVAPLYDEFVDGSYRTFGLDGVRDVADDEPVTNLSFYEADAIARYMNARLPTEAEWEIAASDVAVAGNFAASNAFRALAAPRDQTGLGQLFGDAWEWTRSSYEPYPGFRPTAGALGEYNGKFMCNQMVLRGGSCFSPSDHLRASYRNYWPAETRFQMTGVRLARDADQ